MAYSISSQLGSPFCLKVERSRFRSRGVQYPQAGSWGSPQDPTTRAALHRPAGPQRGPAVLVHGPSQKRTSPGGGGSPSTGSNSYGKRPPSARAPDGGHVSSKVRPYSIQIDVVGFRGHGPPTVVFPPGVSSKGIPPYVLVPSRRAGVYWAKGVPSPLYWAGVLSPFFFSLFSPLCSSFLP